MAWSVMLVLKEICLFPFSLHCCSVSSPSSFLKERKETLLNLCRTKWSSAFLTGRSIQPSDSTTIVGLSWTSSDQTGGPDSFTLAFRFKPCFPNQRLYVSLGDDQAGTLIKVELWFTVSIFFFYWLRTQLSQCWHLEVDLLQFIGSPGMWLSEDCSHESFGHLRSCAA